MTALFLGRFAVGPFTQDQVVPQLVAGLLRSGAYELSQVHIVNRFGTPLQLLQLAAYRAERRASVRGQYLFELTPARLAFQPA